MTPSSNRCVPSRTPARLALRLHGVLALAAALAAHGAVVVGCAGSGAGEPPLVRAARSGQAEQVTQLLDAGADVDTRDAKGATALYWASQSDKLPIAKLLVARGAAADAPFNARYSPLIRAATSGDADIVELLLAAGANPNAVNRNGVGPLHHAAAKGHLDVVRLLLDAGADVDLAEYDGDTALINAAEFGHPEVVALLLERGADPTLPGSSGNSAAEHARRQGHPEVVAALTKAERSPRRPQPRTTPGASTHGGTSAARSAPVSPPRPSREYGSRYQRRIAAVIGINDYLHWPALTGAAPDARRMAAALREIGFDQVVELYDRDATRQAVLKLLGKKLPSISEPEDLVVIFFAGHGQTETLPGGEKRGYIIPVDGDDKKVFSTAISMETLRDLSNRLAAKHIYYAMDSCYSGLGLTRGLTLASTTPGFVDKVTSMPAVQMVTAGMEGEQAIERDGAGVFTSFLIRAIGGEADADGDGFVTATEVAAFVRPGVTRETDNKQTPQFGTVAGSGEVVFGARSSEAP